MNNLQLESLLSAARPQKIGHYSAFTQAVMGRIKTNERLQQLSPTKSRFQHSLLRRLHAFHGPGLMAAILVAILLLGGVAYASVRFVPDLIEILEKRFTSEGRVEYTAPAFKDCYTHDGPKVDTFEIRPESNLSDDEVKKILQAKCELMGLDKFARETWPTYGERQQWQDGDDIFYARPDLMGRVREIDARSLTLVTESLPSGSHNYSLADNVDLAAFVHGKDISVADIKPGDLVFTIVRATEKYYRNAADRRDQPKPVGLIAIVKLTLPEKYYTSMQSHLIEILPCMNNANERCSTGLAAGGIMVFPQKPTETIAGPSDDEVRRDIEGIVTKIETDHTIIKSSSGALYTIHLNQTVFDQYNMATAPKYDFLTPSQPDKIRVRVGSRLQISYTQAPTADPRQIVLDNNPRITLLADLPKK